MAVIAVSWIQGVVRIATATPGKVLRSSEAGTLVSSPADFLPILNQLLTTTRVSGTEVIVCTDNPVINPLVEETPPANAKVVANLLARRVEKAKPFPEPSLFGYARVNPEAKSGPQAYLVTASPKRFVDEMDTVITAQGLDFIGYYPAALSLRSVLRSLPSPGEQVVLLVADAETGLMQVIGRSNGQVLFYRTLGTSEGRGAEGVQREIRRTLLFAEQKLNAKVSTIYTSGTSSTTLLQGMSGADGLQIFSASINVDPSLYLRAITALKSTSIENILPAAISQRGKRRRMRLGINLFLGAVLIFSFFDTTQVQYKKISLNNDIRNLGDQIAARQQEVVKAREDLQALSTRQETIRILEEEADSPVVESIYRSLDGVIPSGLVLDRCMVWLDKIGPGGRAEYLVQIEGTVPEGKALLPLIAKIGETMERSGLKMTVEAKTGDAAAPGADPKKPEGSRKSGGYFIRARIR
ncbi:hypothetical protein EBT23_03550 [bacterium]|nr:hypothetical protein [bacterium]